MPKPTFFNLPEDKRQNLLLCAIDEFARHDYKSASVTSIVARAGIAKGSLYQYFEDKNDLYHYLLEMVTQKKAEIMAGALPSDNSRDIFETLRQLFSKMAEFEIHYPDLAQIGYRALNGESPLPEDIITKGRQATRDFFVQLIETGKRNGSVHPDVDAVAGGYVITASITELGSYLIHQAKNNGTEIILNPRAEEIETVFHHIVSILQFGMGNRSSK